MGSTVTGGNDRPGRSEVPKPPKWIVQAALVTLIIGAVVTCVSSVTISEAEKRRCATCQSNMKETAVALMCYWNDYDAMLPSSMLVSGAKRWNKSDFAHFATRVGGAAGQASTWSSVLRRYAKNAQAFCPSDPSDHKAAGAETSYWWKCAVDKAWYGVGCSRPCRKEVDFAYNADQIFLYEHNGWHFGQTNGLRNGTRINVAYLDSHVKTVTLRNATSGDPVACAANNDGEPMYFNFDQDQPRLEGVNPPRRGNAPRYTDPSRYSDVFD